MAIRIALAGNPNSGKTTMFNALTGSTQYVGNWPGVTVEKKEGKLKGRKDVQIIDLPGIYSLSPYTLEEVVSRNYLLGEKPDIIINLVDASNIERNLYLTTQLTEMGIPVIVALNMIDVANKNGDRIDTEKLSQKLGCPVLKTAAISGEGLKELTDFAVKAAGENIKTSPVHTFAPATEKVLEEISDVIRGSVDETNLRWYAIKLFERDSKILESVKLDSALTEKIEAITLRTEEDLDDDSESIITDNRYAYIEKVVSSSVKKGSTGLTASDKIDKIVTNKWLALPIFAAVMIFVYYISISTVGDWVTAFTNDTLFGETISPAVEGFLLGAGVNETLVGLVVDGIIGGVGAVLGFVPQMLILFVLLAILEDCGYMARVAFIMDRVFRKFGLSGKSFIPMLIGSGCSVPGIMASRTVENERDRRMTIMTTSFIPCGAKMPIIALLAGALFGGAWWVAPSAYFLGIAAVIFSGIVLKKTKMFAGDPAPFVMELPRYHIPAVGNVLKSTWERGSSFIKKAGTVILLSSILVWALLNYGFADGSIAMVEDIDASILAGIGNAIAPIFSPLGFGNWQAAVATVLGLVAKEEVVSVFGIIYGVAGDALELVESGAFDLLEPIALQFTPLSSYSFLIFNLLCAPCFAAIGAIKREMNSTKWTLFAVGYQTLLAFAVSFVFYSFGTVLFEGAAITAVTVAAAAVLALMIYLLVRPAPKYKSEELTSVHKAAAKV